MTRFTGVLRGVRHGARSMASSATRSMASAHGMPGGCLAVAAEHFFLVAPALAVGFHALVLQARAEAEDMFRDNCRRGSPYGAAEARGLEKAVVNVEVAVYEALRGLLCSTFQ